MALCVESPTTEMEKCPQRLQGKVNSTGKVRQLLMGEAGGEEGNTHLSSGLRHPSVRIGSGRIPWDVQSSPDPTWSCRIPWDVQSPQGPPWQREGAERGSSTRPSRSLLM